MALIHFVSIMVVKLNGYESCAGLAEHDSIVDVWARALFERRMFVGEGWHFRLTAAMPSYQHYVIQTSMLLQPFIRATELTEVSANSSYRTRENCF